MNGYKLTTAAALIFMSTASYSGGDNGLPIIVDGDYNNAPDIGYPEDSQSFSRFNNGGNNGGNRDMNNDGSDIDNTIKVTRDLVNSGATDEEIKTILQVKSKPAKNDQARSQASRNMPTMARTTGRSIKRQMPQSGYQQNRASIQNGGSLSISGDLLDTSLTHKQVVQQRQAMAINQAMIEAKTEYYESIKKMKTIERELGVGGFGGSGGRMVNGLGQSSAGTASPTAVVNGLQKEVEELSLVSTYGKDVLTAEIFFRGGRSVIEEGDELFNNLVVSKIEKHRVYVHKKNNVSQLAVIEMKSPAQMQAEYQKKLNKKQKLF